ncbi:MAG: YggU family protein [Firmicutes bacterium]|nr:YggU family protein [Bacillota bacterium]
MPNLRPWVNPTGNCVRIQVKVQPRAARNEIAGVAGDYVKVRLTAPPVEGEANKLLQKFLGEVFGCGAGNVKILKGLTSSRKLVEINGVTLEEVARLVESSS